MTCMSRHPLEPLTFLGLRRNWGQKTVSTSGSSFLRLLSKCSIRSSCSGEIKIRSMCYVTTTQLRPTRFGSITPDACQHQPSTCWCTGKFAQWAHSPEKDAWQAAHSVGPDPWTATSSAGPYRWITTPSAGTGAWPADRRDEQKDGSGRASPHQADGGNRKPRQWTSAESIEDQPTRLSAGPRVGQTGGLAQRFVQIGRFISRLPGLLPNGNQPSMPCLWGGQSRRTPVEDGFQSFHLARVIASRVELVSFVHNH